jgi:hypothetical protein
MKSNPKSTDEYTAFQSVLRRSLQVSKQELDRRVAEDDESRRMRKAKPGPKPRSSASGHVSSDKD